MLELAAMVVLGVAVLSVWFLGGSVSYLISMTSDVRLRKYNRHWIGPPSWTELSEIEEYCFGKSEFRRIRELARAARISRVAAAIAAAVAFTMVIFNR